MNEQDEEFAKQAWTENGWDGYLNVPKLVALIRADERKVLLNALDSGSLLFTANQLDELLNKIRADERADLIKFFDNHWRSDWSDDQIIEALEARGNT